MSTPASPSSDEGASRKNLEQITFRFCSECSNMLYPKEDEDAHKLQFTCRTCQYTEEATSTCVFRNVLNNAAGETAGVTQDVGSDPTVGNPTHFSASPALCLGCGIPLLCCDRCDDPASLDEFLAFVRGNSDYQVKKSLEWIRTANCLDIVDFRTSDLFETDKHEPPIYEPKTSAVNGIANYLPWENQIYPDADPPEAGGEEYDLSTDGFSEY